MFLEKKIYQIIKKIVLSLKSYGALNIAGSGVGGAVYNIYQN